MKKLGFVIFVAFMIVIGYFFRDQIMWGIGRALISEDEIKPAEVIFVLGGNSFDRGNHATFLWEEGYGEKIICVGENVSGILKALHREMTESEVAEVNIENNGVPANKVEVLLKGTSTKEESEAILNYCLENKVQNLIVVSDKFHTRRIRMVFDPLFEDTDINLMISGAPNSVYDEEKWWKTEEGLIMVNNEYVKLVYYLIKY